MPENTSIIRREFAHVGCATDALLGPFVLLLVRGINLLIRSNVRSKICGDQVKVLADSESTYQWLEDLGIFKCALLDGHDHSLQSRVHWDVTVSVYQQVVSMSVNMNIRCKQIN